MGKQVSYAKDLPDIPSEYLEPYLQRFMMAQLEGIAYGYIAPSKAKEDLKAIDTFVSMFGGLHSRYAMMNQYYRFKEIPDDELQQIAKETFNHH